MPGEYPRRLGASPLRAKALFIKRKYVTTRNILMNVVTEFYQIADADSNLVVVEHHCIKMSLIRYQENPEPF